MDGRPNHFAVEGDVGTVVIGDHDVLCDRRGTTTSPTRPPTARRRTPPPSLLWATRDAPLGREAELRAVHDHLDARRHVQVHGPPGCGKSLLLRHVSRDRPTGDGVICLSANGKTVDDLVQDVFEACYEAPVPYRPSPAHLRRLLGPVRALLVLDDLSDDPEDIEFVLDAVPGCTVLAGSVERTLWAAGRAVRLGELSEDAGTALVRRVLGREPTAAELWRVRAARGSPPALQRIGTATLDPVRGRVLRVLALLGGAACPVALTALLAGVDPAAVGPVLADLERVGFTAASGDGYRIAVEFDEVAAPEPVATALADWLRRGPDGPEVVAAGPVVVAVLHAAGATPAALDLARTAAPALLRVLRLGAWGQVLHLGADVADRLAATRELAYFRHEIAVRDRLLAGARERPSWQVLTPLVLLLLFGVGIAWVALNARGTSDPGTPAPAPAGPGPTSSTSGPGPEPVPATVPEPGPGPGPTAAPTAAPARDVPCPPVLPATREFAGPGDTASLSIAATPCTGAVAAGRVSLEGAGAASFTVGSDCPEVLAVGEGCSLTVSFVAGEPGSHSASLVLPGAGATALTGVVEEEEPVSTGPTTEPATPTGEPSAP
ncbi:hypothetical protein [Saccharothrix sp. Mg75]|uniref:ATP-binding protein n=1 Tax=Saccharothrix sp. Mg75 TaxID=3445357 RepID=UPI003EE8B63D